MVTYDAYNDQLIHQETSYDISRARMIAFTEVVDRWRDLLLRRPEISKYEDHFIIDDRFIWMGVYSEYLVGYAFVPRVKE